MLFSNEYNYLTIIQLSQQFLIPTMHNYRITWTHIVHLTWRKISMTCIMWWVWVFSFRDRRATRGCRIECALYGASKSNTDLLRFDCTYEAQQNISKAPGTTHSQIVSHNPQYNIIIISVMSISTQVYWAHTIHSLTHSPLLLRSDTHTSLFRITHKNDDGDRHGIDII